MQTRVFLEAVRSIKASLRWHEINQFLEPMVEAKNAQISDDAKQQWGGLALAAHREAQVLAKTEPYRSLLSDLGASFVDAVYVTNLIAEFHQTTNWHQLRQKWDFMELYFRTDALAEMWPAIYKRIVAPALEEVPKGNEVVAIEVVDFEGAPIPAKRLRNVVGQLESLYAAVAEAATGASDESRIAYLDSGSDFTIGLEGLGEAIDAIRRLFGAAWDKIRFMDHESIERDWQTVLQGLDVLKIIRERQASGDLDPEAAERLEFQVRTRMEELFGDGAFMADLPTVAESDRSSILTAVRSGHLLGPGEEEGG